MIRKQHVLAAHDLSFSLPCHQLLNVVDLITIILEFQTPLKFDQFHDVHLSLKNEYYIFRYLLHFALLIQWMFRRFRYPLALSLVSQKVKKMSLLHRTNQSFSLFPSVDPFLSLVLLISLLGRDSFERKYQTI